MRVQIIKERGQGLTEYALIISMVILIILFFVVRFNIPQHLSDEINFQLKKIENNDESIIPVEDEDLQEDENDNIYDIVRFIATVSFIFLVTTVIFITNKKFFITEHKYKKHYSK